MKKKDFMAQYQTKEWYEISKRIKARDNNTCQMCGCNNKPLSVHHLCYGDNGSIFENSDDELITLCEDCHKSQKESQTDIFDTIKSLKAIYTDFELDIILRCLLWEATTSLPAIFIELEPSKKYIEDLDKNDYEKAKRLLEWRKKVRLGFCRKEVIAMYKSGWKYSDDLKQWFYKTFGEDIEVVSRNME